MMPLNMFVNINRNRHIKNEKKNVPGRQESCRLFFSFKFPLTLKQIHFKKDTVTVLKQCLQRECKGSEVFSFNASLVDYSQKPITASIQASGKLFLLHPLTPKIFNTESANKRPPGNLKLGKHTSSQPSLNSQENKNEKKKKSI